MLKLMKYEWMNRWKFFLAGMIVCILLNIDIITKLISADHRSSVFSVVLILTVFAMGVVLAFDHTRRMYISLFTDEAQFLFTTPLSGYTILAEKIFSIMVECIGIALFGGVVGFIDYKILNNKFPNISNMPRIEEFLLPIMKIVISILFGYVALLLMIYLSMALAKSIFSSIKYGKTMSFIFFIVIAQIVGRITSGLNRVHLFDEYFLLNISFICIIAILFATTGYLLDRKVNL